jgi:pimeloyl-ACP methyl ester carboxylesterase
MRTAVVAMFTPVLLSGVAIRTAEASWEESHKLTASDAEASDYFGHAVSLSGDVAVVGAYVSDDHGSASGSAYVFRFDETTWEEEKLTANDAASGDQFGVSVSVLGDLTVIGAPGNDFGPFENVGSIYTYRFDGSDWGFGSIWVASDADVQQVFGTSVCAGADVILIGAPGDSRTVYRAGAAYVFRFGGPSIGWIEEQKMTASDAAANDLFGDAVSMSGEVAVIGAPGHDHPGTGAGSAYIFRFNGTTWIEEQELLNSDGEGDNYHFGRSVSISGDVAVIGAANDSNGGLGSSGSARVYRFDGISWSEEQKLTASDAESGAYFGTAVSVDRHVAVIGSYSHDAGSNSGSAYVYRFDGSSWVEEQKLTASDAETRDYFGTSISINGDFLVVGAERDSDGAYASGSAYVFQNLSPRERILTDCRTIDTAGILFHERYTTDATGIGLPLGDPYAFSSTRVTLDRAAGDRFYVTGVDGLQAPWICDDKLYINGIPAALGFSGVVDPTLPLCAPIEDVLLPQDALEITDLIPPGTSCVTFELVDTQRAIYGNSEIYLLKDAAPTLSGLRGTVRDITNDAGIPDVTITVSPGGYSTSTRPDGSYLILAIPAGVYDVEIAHNHGNYRVQSFDDLELPAGTIPRLDVWLESRIVLLVHGICGEAENWDSWEAPLEAGGFVVEKALLFPNTQPVRDMEIQLNQQISSILAVKDVHSLQVVAHSMGGLVTRAYIACHPQIVRRLVMLGTPNHGTVVAQLIAPNAPAWRPFGKLGWLGSACDFQSAPRGVRDLVPGSRLLTFLNTGQWEPSVDLPCDPSYGEILREGDNTKYWSLAGGCYSRTFEKIHGPDCPSDCIVPVKSTWTDLSWNCETNSWGCANKHNSSNLVIAIGCTSIYEDSCVRNKVLAILGGGYPEPCYEPGAQPLRETHGTPEAPRVVYSMLTTIASGSTHTDSLWVATPNRTLFLSLGDSVRVASVDLIDPVGTVIDSAYATSDPTIEFIRDGVDILYEVIDPTPGLWQMETVGRW